MTSTEAIVAARKLARETGEWVEVVLRGVVIADVSPSGQVEPTLGRRPSV